jgi:hypothetical protein
MFSQCFFLVEKNMPILRCELFHKKVSGSLLNHQSGLNVILIYSVLQSELLF